MCLITMVINIIFLYFKHITHTLMNFPSTGTRLVYYYYPPPTYVEKPVQLFDLLLEFPQLRIMSSIILEHRAQTIEHVLETTPTPGALLQCLRQQAHVQEVRLHHAAAAAVGSCLADRLHDGDGHRAGVRHRRGRAVGRARGVGEGGHAATTARVVRGARTVGTVVRVRAVLE